MNLRPATSENEAWAATKSHPSSYPNQGKSKWLLKLFEVPCVGRGLITNHQEKQQAELKTKGPALPPAAPDIVPGASRNQKELRIFHLFLFGFFLKDAHGCRGASTKYWPDKEIFSAFQFLHCVLSKLEL